MFVKNFRHSKKWFPGHIVHHRVPVSFKIQLEDGHTCHRHQDQIRKCVSAERSPEEFSHQDQIQKCVSADRSPEESSGETDDTHIPTVRGDTGEIANTATLPAALSDDGCTEQQQQMTDNVSAQVAETGQRGHYPECVRRLPDCLTF